MKNTLLAFALLFLPETVLCQVDAGTTDRVGYVKYSWKTPLKKHSKGLRTAKIFSGTAHDMEHVSMFACELRPSQRPTPMKAGPDQEQLLIIKAGQMHISFSDSVWMLGPGSIVLLMPGEAYSIQARESHCSYYQMNYRSKSPVDTARGHVAGGSIVRDWNRMSFRPHDKGGIRRYVERPTAMCKRFEMHVTTLKAGIKSHDPHTHKAEEIVLMLEEDDSIPNQTEMQIGDRFFKGQPGDLYYLGSNVPHAIQNIGEGPCSYFAYQFD